MSSILYYSNYCEKSKELLTKIAKSNKKEGIHFVCIDKRTQNENNQTYAVLERGNTVLIPPMVDRVPALLLLTNNNEIFFGNQINDKLELDFGAPVYANAKPQQDMQSQMTDPNMEPMAYGLQNSMYGVMSDNYSFLDMTTNEMDAKGDGGLRQMHSYAMHEQSESINTPSDDFVPDKISNDKNLTLENIIKTRENDVNSVPSRTI